jgi:hypothetical protein
MAAVTVSFNGTRLNDSDSSTNWGNFNVSGGAPSSEFPLAYQVTSGTTIGAVNKKINSSTARQGVDYNHGTGQDMTTATKKLWFAKCYISDSFDLNTTWGVELAMGSGDTANDHRYNVAGSGANLSVYSQYPAQGGYLITSIDPEIAAWREAVNGTPDWTSVVWFAVGAQFVNGTAKAENVALDAIDIGKGLNLTGGDGVSTDGDFTSFVSTDQDVKANRWGVVTGSGDNVRAHGLLTIGENTTPTAVATGFTDNTSVVAFPDGYHSRGTVGVEVNIGSATTVVDIGCLLIGEGTRNGVDANDTRPDFTVSGTAGSFTMTGAQLRNFRDVTFTSVCSIQNCDISCFDLVQGSADIEGCTIRTTSLTNTATLSDPTFATSQDLNNCEFVQEGAGHAIEITTPGTYDFQDLTFTGYGGTPGTNSTPSSGAADAAVYNNSGGAVTININGSGNQPSVRNAASSTTTVNQTVTVSVTCVDTSGSPIENARVLVETDPGGVAVIDKVLTNASGVASASYSGSTPQAITGRARKGTTSPFYKSTGITGSISASGFDVTLTMLDDE